MFQPLSPRTNTSASPYLPAVGTAITLHMTFQKVRLTNHKLPLAYQKVKLKGGVYVSVGPFP